VSDEYSGESFLSRGRRATRPADGACVEAEGIFIAIDRRKLVDLLAERERAERVSGDV